jgi:dTDP-4-amino-4,6-dideoxygalactose transaminase
MLQRRKEIIGKYDAVCDELGVLHLDHYREDAQSSGHLYIVRAPGISNEERCEMITKMAEMGIACNVHYKPLPMMTAYKTLGFDIKDYPNAYKYFENEITLPLHTKLSDEDVEYVMGQFKKIVEEYGYYRMPQRLIG